MEKRTIRELLERRLSGEAEEHLLTFVAENAHDILLWRPEQICLKAQITERRLAAFLQTLGCQSLEDFRDVLRSVLYQTAEDSGIAQRSLASITEEIIANEMKNLNELAFIMDYEKVERLTQDILNASDVLVLGRGGASPYATYMARCLNRFGIKANAMSNYTDLLGYLNSHDRSTLVISFTISRYSRESLVYMKALRDRGYRIVSITDRNDSPFAHLSEYYFYMPLHRFDHLESYTAGTTLINVLMSNLGRKNQQKLLSDIRAFEAAAEDVGLYS